MKLTAAGAKEKYRIMARETPRPRSFGLLRDRVADMDRIMERFLELPFSARPSRWLWRRIPSTYEGWAPPLCMWEKEDRYVFRLDIPGVKKEEVDISLAGDILTIRGDRKPPLDVRDEEYQRCEMNFGRFQRDITLPGAVDAEKIRATHEDGVLEIQVPRAEKPVPVKVQIASG